MSAFEKSPTLSPTALAQRMAGNLNYTFKPLNKRPLTVSCIIAGGKVLLQQEAASFAGMEELVAGTDMSIGMISIPDNEPVAGKEPGIVTATFSGSRIVFERTKSFRKDTDLVIKGEGIILGTGSGSTVQLKLKVLRTDWWWQLLLIPVLTGLMAFYAFSKNHYSNHDKVMAWLAGTVLLFIPFFGSRLIREWYQLKLCKQELTDAIDCNVGEYTSKMMQQGNYVM